MRVGQVSADQSLPRGAASLSADDSAESPKDGAAHQSPVPDRDEMKAVVTRLNRARGQLGGIVKMIEDGRDCQDIVTQLSAVSKAVDRAGFAVIALGLRQCIVDPSSQQVDVDAMEKLFLSLA